MREFNARDGDLCVAKNLKRLHGPYALLDPPMVPFNAVGETFRRANL
jgi:hypothetical protein